MCNAMQEETTALEKNTVKESRPLRHVRNSRSDQDLNPGQALDVATVPLCPLIILTFGFRIHLV
jgi:hypothetical protein